MGKLELFSFRPKSGFFSKSHFGSNGVSDARDAFVPLRPSGHGKP